MTLLLAIFEPAYLGGSPIAEAPDIIELVGRCRPILNIRTQMMHQLALIRCCFISYLQAAHAQAADATELVAVLTLMSDCVRQFVAEYAPENHTGESAKFEAAVLPDIVRELEDPLEHLLEARELEQKLDLWDPVRVKIHSHENGLHFHTEMHFWSRL